mmetsp:Transcript_3181/g.4336  ORF Transcript_3181/g.4336 Transcript_3181/m.4336 type:complete len:94 (-) Transcript_3181:111-392(-)
MQSSRFHLRDMSLPQGIAGNTVPGRVASYWFVGMPSLRRIGTITTGIAIPSVPIAMLNATIGWRWMSDLNQPFPYIPRVMPIIPEYVPRMASS